MGDVYIDGRVLAQVREHLRHAREIAERPGREMARIDAAAVGSPELVRKMDDFGHEWSYGIGKIAHFAGAAADAIDRLDKAFADADRSLAQALTQAAHR